MNKPNLRIETQGPFSDDQEQYRGKFAYDSKEETSGRFKTLVLSYRAVGLIFWSLIGAYFYFDTVSDLVFYVGIGVLILSAFLANTIYDQMEEIKVTEHGSLAASDDD